MARLTKTKKLHKGVPIVVGAGITEQYYFYHISNLTNYSFKVRPRFFGTESLTELGKRIDQLSNNGNTVICVFDADVARDNEIEKKKFDGFMKKYRKKENVILCDSLPSIEYWFLIHYKNTNKFFRNSDNVEKALREYINRYEKSASFLENEKWVKEMIDGGKMDKAINRAKAFGINGGSYSHIFMAFK